MFITTLDQSFDNRKIRLCDKDFLTHCKTLSRLSTVDKTEYSYFLPEQTHTGTIADATAKVDHPGISPPVEESSVHASINGKPEAADIQDNGKNGLQITFLGFRFASLLLQCQPGKLGIRGSINGTDPEGDIASSSTLLCHPSNGQCYRCTPYPGTVGAQRYQDEPDLYVCDQPLPVIYPKPVGSVKVGRLF